MELVKRILAGSSLTDEEALGLAAYTDLPVLMAAADSLCQSGHGSLVSYSRKVFIPLTHLCRDVCHYCTFSQPPHAGEAAYLSIEEVLEIARAGAAAGCTEALFTLGDKPEDRFHQAGAELEKLGHSSTLSYLREAAGKVMAETGLLPHLNPGLMTAEDFANLRPVSASMGIMLEGVADSLMQKGGVHYGSPDKAPLRRLETIAQAGEGGVPFTSGILIGIGETRGERIVAMLALRALHRRYGHIQEIIVQNFRAKTGTKMAKALEPSHEDLLWTIAVARLVFGPEMNIQAPPNLAKGALGDLIRAGINDWGGVSPVTPDYVNPEAAWPHLVDLELQTESAGRRLVSRLPLYPSYVNDSSSWLDPSLRQNVLDLADGDGYAKTDRWAPGAGMAVPNNAISRGPMIGGHDMHRIIEAAQHGKALAKPDVIRLFQARGSEMDAVLRAADELRASTNGDVVSYVVNRNINYTNMCSYKCGFCAFSKGKTHEHLRGRPYNITHEEIARRTVEAWERGATEVCMQGGIHPDYTGQTYLDILHTVKAARPDMHVHAFSPLEVTQGARTLGISIEEFLTELHQQGLGSLPGTAAEILDDDVRHIICPDKLRTDEWLDVMRTAHHVGLRTTSTIMFGHVEGPDAWANHLLRLRALQEETGGFTEFVPLPFVHMEAPIYLKGRARRGPSFRETVLMHAVARLVFNPVIPNIQASWVKLGPDGVAVLLKAGVNDLGGTLMNESISRAAGASFGQEMVPEAMEALIASNGRVAHQRTTLYKEPSAGQRGKSFNAPALSDIVNASPVRPARHHV